LSIISVIDVRFVIFLDDGSQSGFVGVLFSGVKYDVLHGSEVLGWTFYDFVLESRESVDGSLALFFF
jgi:hypothetical protein